MIGARAGRLAEQLLRRHVRRRAGDHAGIGQPRHRRQVLRRDVELREAEVEDLDAAARGEDDVLGLEVAMHDAAIVRGLQRRGDRPRDLERARFAAADRAASSSRSVRPSRYSDAMKI